MLTVRLDDDNLAVAKEAMDMKKPLTIPEDLVEPIFLDLTLRYSDLEGKEHSFPYKYKYIFHDNAWVIRTE